MFNIGGGELIVIMLIALIVLGPSRLPDAARQVGKTMGDLRRLSTGFQNEMKSTLDAVDDPTRVSARRNVLAKEAPATSDTDGDASPDAGEAHTPAAGAIAAVSAQPSAPAKEAPPSAQAESATKKITAAKSAAPTAKKAGPTAAKKVATKKATPAAKKKADPAVSKAAPRRTED